MRLALLLLLSVCRAQVPAAEVPEPAFRVEQFEVSGDNPLDPAATDAALAPFLGEHVGIEGLYAARDALRSALRQAGHSFLDVVVPPQTLEGGAVRLDVVSVALDGVVIRGNQHFSTDSVRRSLPALVPGVTPQVRALSRDLAVANQHPAKKLKLNFRASEERADAVDAAVDVTDRRPWSLFAGLNNIGNKATGYTRMAVGG
jgi:hemolysin activation/secretion protein